MSEQEVLQETVRYLEQLPEPAILWIKRAVTAMADDETGEIGKLIQRHTEGERIAEEYLDGDTGEVNRVPEEERTNRHLPMIPGI